MSLVATISMKEGATVGNTMSDDAAALVEKVSTEAADAMPQAEIPAENAEETPAN